MNAYKTEQEHFWAGEFGNKYINRNPQDFEMAARLNMFSKIFNRTEQVESIIEFGANIGNNLQALKLLAPKAEFSAIEINDDAVKELAKKDDIKVYHQSIIDFEVDYERDLAFTSGVLIHMNPDVLPAVYDSLHNCSQKYICVIEYYNPSPVEIPYRGHSGKLFKRDFAGEILERYKDLKLVDYGFMYHKDPNFPLDDLTWFLLEKVS